MGKGATKVPVRILNLSPDGVTIYKGTKLAKATSLEEDNVVLISEVSSTGTHCCENVSADKRQLLWEAVESTASDPTDGHFI